jgi:hypothetical protein
VGCFVRVACHVARDVFGCSLGLLAGLSGGVCFAAHQPSLCCGVVERWMTLLSFGGWHVCWPDFVPVSALWRVVRGFASVGLFPTCGFLIVVTSLVCSGLHSVVLWDVWPALLGICAWRLSGSLPGVSHHCLSILQVARCFSPGSPPRRQLLKWPCGLPVSCPGVSRLASRGLSLHDLVL